MKLNDRMEMDHVIRVHADGSVTDATGEYAPEVYITLDTDGQTASNAEREMIDSVESQGWDLMTGYTGQYSYNGPIMHTSEFIGGRLARDILETPGVYVACEVRGSMDVPEDEMTEEQRETEDEPIGWVVARKVSE